MHQDLSGHEGRLLRLVWPQWQGAGTSSVAEFAPEFDLPVARRGYAVGSAVLDALLPPRQDAAATVPVAMSDEGLGEEGGVEARSVVVRQLADALAVLDDERPDRVLTLGGECSVSVAPFSYLARRHGDELAVVWIDAHPDVDTPDTEYAGYHAMAVSMLVGKGPEDAVALLPATIGPNRLAIAGLHAWTEDAIGHVREWGIASFSPADLAASSQPLLDWLAHTGCTKVAVHFDVDAIDSAEGVLGLGKEPDGLTGAQVHRIVADLAAQADVVGLTIAEFIPRQAMQLLDVLDGMPLVGGIQQGRPR